MLAYRVNIYGTGDKHYIITPAQKPEIEKVVLKLPGTATLKIGEDIIRVSTIKSITATQVDVESCPDYFQRRVEAERKGGNEQKIPGYRKLPTDWVLLTKDGRIFKTDIGARSVAEITGVLLAQGDPEKNKDLRFIAAKCHFKFGPDGQKQFFVSLEQIPEALECFPNAENPSCLLVRKIFKYGIKQA